MKSSMLLEGLLNLVHVGKDALPPQLKALIGSEDGSSQYGSQQMQSQVFPSGMQLTQNIPSVSLLGFGAFSVSAFGFRFTINNHHFMNMTSPMSTNQQYVSAPLPTNQQYVASSASFGTQLQLAQQGANTFQYN